MRNDLRVSVLLAVIAIATSASAAEVESPALRLLGFDAKDTPAARLWRQSARTTLFALLNMDDQVWTNRHDAQGRSPIPLNPKVLSSKKQPKFTRYDLEIDSRADRQIPVVLTVPNGAAAGKTPAVVCIHGHGGNRNIVYEPKSAYRGFALTLAENGYVTLSTDVGQHEVQGEGRTLMGERLWDLIRVVDLAASRPEVDPRRIGCGGLSLGGEMSMWLGAMDERIAATVSSGFLTTMDQMEQNHCTCWKFPGLRELVDYADIYSLIAPRPLMCQNGLQEPSDQFFVPLAQEAMEEIRVIYDDFGQSDCALLDVHPGCHEIHLPTVLAFVGRFLGSRVGAPDQA